MMHKKNKTILSLFLLGLTVIANSEAAFASDKKTECVSNTKDNHAAVTFFLVDRSDKIQDASSLEQVFSAIKEDVGKNDKGERLIIGVITGKSSKTRILMDRVTPEDSIFENVMKLRKKKKDFKYCIDQAKNEMLKQDESHKTSAILETLYFVSKVLGKDKSEEKRLVMHSDMIQNSKFLSFYRADGKKPPAQLITYIEEDYLMPNMTAVEVYVAGVGGNLSDKKMRHIEKFWEQYFETAGAEMQFYGPLLSGL